MLDTYAAQERLSTSCNFSKLQPALFLYDYQFYKRCFQSRRVCGLLTSLYQSKVACVAPAAYEKKALVKDWNTCVVTVK